MDWYLDTRNPQATRALRHACRDYLLRHAGPGSDVDSAELVLAEMLSNAAEHASGPTWVSVDWSQQHPELAVHDLGPGFDPRAELPANELSEHGRGLFIVAQLSDRLHVAAKRGGGSTVRAQLPVRRPEAVSHDPPRRNPDALPTPEEASAEGTFGVSAFLRALVVQLAQAAEHHHGPGDVEALVAQVGIDVGSRMEEEHRRAEQVVGALTPEQMGDLFVRLKAAINGGFSVVEANEERIVLVNTACPFGDAVMRAPGLCRMTSSVFGGIAARNTGAATINLEERIAVGDPGCRVTVWLNDVEGNRPGHWYRAPESVSSQVDR